MVTEPSHIFLQQWGPLSLKWRWNVFVAIKERMWNCVNTPTPFIQKKEDAVSWTISFTSYYTVPCWFMNKEAAR